MPNARHEFCDSVGQWILFCVSSLLSYGRQRVLYMLLNCVRAEKSIIQLPSLGELQWVPLEKIAPAFWARFGKGHALITHQTSRVVSISDSEGRAYCLTFLGPHQITRLFVVVENK